MTTKAKKIVGHYGDDVLFCSCGEILAIHSKERTLIIVRNRAGLRIEIPQPEGTLLSCVCRKGWKLVGDDMEVQDA